MGDGVAVDDAVAAARGASTEWAAVTPQRRFDVLDAIGTRILARKAELGRLLAREEGKTLAEGTGEAARAGMIFKFFAGEALRISGEKVDSIRTGVDVEITREPLGVIGIITPLNFPIAIPAWKIAPALAYGNAVVFKPATLVPGCAWAMADIIQQAGLSDGLFNLVMGRGRVVGEAILDHPDIAAVSFTGPVDTGAHVAQRCAARLGKFQLEMGGKNPLVVLDDADIPTAVNCAVQGAFYSTGQRCTASSRLVVTEGIHDRFVDALVERMKSLKVDDALAEGADIGPVVDQSQSDKDLGYLEIGKAEGARLITGGRTLQRAKKGHYLEPALFTETTPGMRINKEEIFGPIASVIRVGDYAEALEIANDTPFGLSAGICTTSS
jgi:acyl-CoA reductase-like NAD-dependent aldehyde dehydrogenase